MRLVIQRVSEARVCVNARPVGAIGSGLCILLGIGKQDTAARVKSLAEKVAALRIFADTDGKMNRSVADTGGEILVVSQFTLYGDTRKGNRPSFTAAAEPKQAKQLYEQFVQRLRDSGLPVATGEFGAHMQVSLVNDGPVTLILES